MKFVFGLIFLLCAIIAFAIGMTMAPVFLKWIVGGILLGMIGVANMEGASDETWEHYKPNQTSETRE